MRYALGVLALGEEYAAPMSFYGPLVDENDDEHDMAPSVLEMGFNSNYADGSMVDQPSNLANNTELPPDFPTVDIASAETAAKLR